jgi:hypothetical protein
VSKDKLTPYLRAFQLRCELYRKPGDEALKHALDAAPLKINNVLHKSVNTITKAYSGAGNFEGANGRAVVD